MGPRDNLGKELDQLPAPRKLPQGDGCQQGHLPRLLKETQGGPLAQASVRVCVHLWMSNLEPAGRLQRKRTREGSGIALPSRALNRVHSRLWWARDSLGLCREGGKGQRIGGCGSVGAWALEGQIALAFRGAAVVRGLLRIQRILRGRVAPLSRPGAPVRS